ncbi:putative membrane protein [Microvirga lotononidis]|uniref:Putative membrane protein n=2 Tax=Microvirga lotononidis TaxID=864069 RepID=I4YQ94_9HYPH|nr:putative membrane protein [Microvirga lotononidis]
MAFSGRGRDFLKLLIAGSLFQIPTFGFYRFWMITKLRRHLWANTQVEGEPFEYTGTAKELLIGFLIALAVLGPIYIAYFILTFMAEERYAFVSVPLILVMYVLAHFGSYRARKYRASRTVFRGIRFWMKGSGWAYAGRAILWDIATLLTLGLALPWATASLERYRMRQTYFGSVRGDFAGTGWTLFKRGWRIWALGLVVVAFELALTILVSSPSGMMFLPHYSVSLVGVMILGFLVIVVAGVVLLPLAMAIFTRWHIDGLRFGDVTIVSKLRLGTFYGLFFKLIFSSIGFAIAFFVLVGIATVLAGIFLQDTLAALKSGEITVATFGIGTLIVIAYLFFLLGFGVLQRYFLVRGLWAAVVMTTTVANLRSIYAVVAAGQPAGLLGEGLADALDFNVGI